MEWQNFLNLCICQERQLQHVEDYRQVSGAAGPGGSTEVPGGDRTLALGEAGASGQGQVPVAGPQREGAVTPTLSAGSTPGTGRWVSRVKKGVALFMSKPQT